MSTFDTLLEKLPSLRHIINTYGDLSLFEYAKKYYTPAHHPIRTHQQELFDFLSEYIVRKFGTQISKKVITSLENNYAVSTAEHHGPIGHPFFFQSAIIRGLVQRESIVNFCTSHVSLGNSSYPRGIVFHGDGDAAPQKYLHLPLFPARERMMPVFQHHSFTKDDMSRLSSQLKTYQKNRYIRIETYEKIEAFIHNFLLREDILNAPTYSHQITLVNHSVWSYLFHDLPDYIALDSEDMICDILCLHLQKKTNIAHMITSIEIQSDIEKHFDTIACCFNKKEKVGTYLFWYQDIHGVRQSLWREGDMLVSNDKSIRIKIDTPTLSHLLSIRTLIPSGLLVYSIFSCYYGLTCFGGFSQGDYLPKIQQAYGAIFGKTDEFLPQNGILNEDFVFLFDKEHRAQTALDVFIQRLTTAGDMTILSKNISLRESIQSMSDEIARCL